MAVIDASNLVFGRLASIAAERALKGERIDIINVEKTVIIGRRGAIIERYKKRLHMRGKGDPEKGPKYSRTPQRILRNAVKGMLPSNRERGRAALKRVRSFIGVPERLNGKEAETIKIAAYNGKEDCVELGELSNALGWKWLM